MADSAAEPKQSLRLNLSSVVSKYSSRLLGKTCFNLNSWLDQGSPPTSCPGFPLLWWKEMVVNHKDLSKHCAVISWVIFFSHTELLRKHAFKKVYESFHFQPSSPSALKSANPKFTHMALSERRLHP